MVAYNVWQLGESGGLRSAKLSHKHKCKRKALHFN